MEINRFNSKSVYNLYRPGELDEMVSLVLSGYNDNVTKDKHLKPEEIQNMNSDVFCLLVSHVLKELNKSFVAGPERSSLPEFEALGFTEGLCTYDSTIDNIYVEASKYFGQPNNDLDIGVFWFPEKDLKRAKHVIAWLALFAIFTDEMGGNFEQKFETEMQGVQKIVKLYEEIDEISADITQSCIETEEEQESIPQVLEETTEVEMKTKIALEELDKLEAEAYKVKATHDAEVFKIHALEKKREDMDLEISTLKDELVTSPSKIQKPHEMEKQKVTELQSRRQELGMELSLLEIEQQKELRLMQRMKNTYEAFEGVLVSSYKAIDCFALLQKATEDCDSKQNELLELKKDIKRFKAERKRQHVQASKRLERIQHEYRKQERDSRKLQEEILECEEQNAVLRKKISDAEAKILEYKEFFEKFQKGYHVPDDDISLLRIYGIKRTAKNGNDTMERRKK